MTSMKRYSTRSRPFFCSRFMQLYSSLRFPLCFSIWVAAFECRVCVDNDGGLLSFLSVA